MKYILRSLPVLSVFLLLSCSGNREVTVKELQEHIKYLSSDSLKGRLTGSQGDSLAAEYIKAKLLSYGLVPLSGDGLQRYKVTKRVIPGKSNSLSAYGTDYVIEKDFTPFAFSSNNSLEAEVVFAGYGFNLNNDSLKWDDYKGIDVKGKWVMILRGDPENENTKSPFLSFQWRQRQGVTCKRYGRRRYVDGFRS